ISFALGCSAAFLVSTLMPARILPPAGMRTVPCPSSVGSAGRAPLIVTTAFVMLRLLCNARELASPASRTKPSLQVLASHAALRRAPPLCKQKGGKPLQERAPPVLAG